MGHQDGSHGKGMSGKKHIVWTDRLSIWTHWLQGHEYLGCTPRRVSVKILNSGNQASQELQPRNCSFSIWTSRCAVLQLKPRDRRKAAFTTDITVEALRIDGGPIFTSSTSLPSKTNDWTANMVQ
jgi:hypothetical protein